MSQLPALTAPDTSARALIRLAWPLLIANLAVVGNGTIDAIMAGRLSPTDLAAVAVGSSVYVTIYIGFMGVLQALSPIAGHHFGAERWRAIGHDVQQAIWLALLLAAIGLPCVLAADFWTDFTQVDSDVASVLRRYLAGIAFGLPAGLATRVFVALNAAVSRPKVTMVINVTALALKAPLNMVLMHGAGPIPALGGAGAGVATALLAWLMLGLSVAVWRFDPFYARFRSTTLSLPRWSSLRELLKLGIPIGLATMFEVTSFTFMAVLIARLGTAAVAGHQIISNLVAVLFMLPLSLGIATSVLVAQSLGAGHPRIARNAALRGFRVTMAFAMMAAALLWLLREPIVGFYTSDPAVAAIALSLIGLAAIFHLFDAGQGVSGFILRGYKNTFWPMVIYGVALWGIGLGGGVWIGLTANPFGPPRGPLGFWQAATVALAVAAAALSVLAALVSRRQMSSHKKGPEDRPS